jgi:hypothetical protein
MAETQNDNEVYHFAKLAEGDEGIDASSDTRCAILAVCVADQQRAGFKSYIDLRQASCPDCTAPGFNTGWGFWRFACGAEILSDGEPCEPCGDKSESING